jgi:hypothetical protein
MDFAQQLHDMLTAAATRLEADGSALYAGTAAKIRAKAAELKPVLEADAKDAEERALALVHDLFGNG